MSTTQIGAITNRFLLFARHEQNDTQTNTNTRQGEQPAEPKRHEYLWV